MHLTNLTSERLILRPHRLEDLEVYHAWRSDREIMYYSLLPRSTSLEESREMLEADIRNRDSEHFSLYALERGADGAYIGSTGFDIQNKKESGGIAKIGYFLLKEYQRQGYAAEAAALLIAWIFDNLDIHKVFASCDSRNAASERVMQKIGMQQEALLRKDRFIQGQWSDTLKYALLREEWITRDSGQA